jgi:DnaB helicase-like protein/Toprim domain-containing protein/CHC2-type zinc finger protein
VSKTSSDSNKQRRAVERDFPLTLKHFGLSGKERVDRLVPCPFHDDSNASASISVKKSLLHCFTCKKGWHFSQVEEHLGGAPVEAPPPEPEPVPNEPAPDVAADDIVALAERHLVEDRGLPADPDLLGVDMFVDTETDSKFYGYLMFQRGRQLVGRNLLNVTDSRPRYMNTAGSKDLFFIGDDSKGRAAWLVEGIFDALAVHQAGIGPVAALLGCEISENQAYLLRNRTVFILLDADQAGWKGARDIAKELKEYGANGIIVELPEDMGKDPGEAYKRDPEGFSRWLTAKASEYSANDTGYVARLFDGEEPPLLCLPSGIQTWDANLGGGFKDGAHVIGAEPGVGKTSFVLRRAYEWALTEKKRILYVTYEISKRQTWARLASCASTRTWSEIEMSPGIVADDTFYKMQELAELVRVGVGWDVNKIQYAAEHYDVIVIDYLQRMPGPFGGDATRQNIDHNVMRLSDLARDRGRVILVISTLPRAAYNGQFSMSSFKESGGIEYVCQSATGLLLGGPNLAIGKIVKNTRGSVGNFWMRTDLGHLRFEEAQPGNAAVTEEMRNAFK